MDRQKFALCSFGGGFHHAVPHGDVGLSPSLALFRILRGKLNEVKVTVGQRPLTIGLMGTNGSSIRVQNRWVAMEPSRWSSC